MISESIISNRLKLCLESCLEIAGHEGLDVIISAINGVIANMNAPMQLAIIGKVSSSKSTIVNTILGQADVVGTGVMEETYNVSWLKYGPSDSDVKVVFKDGSVKTVARSDWKSWSGQEEMALKDKVKYLEVMFEHEMLKIINIIDTPGLDSMKGADSRNTIEFLHDVQPDAVLLVFTKGLAQSTLDVVKEFQGEGVNQFHLSPLNAVGIMAKTDYLWHIKNPDVIPGQEGWNVIRNNIYELFPEIKDSLYEILPFCALLGLASYTLDSRDVDLLEKLAKTEEKDLHEMFFSVSDFIDESYKTDISAEEREYLCKKFGLYGIYEALVNVRVGGRSQESLKRLFREISGMDEFEKCLYAHFGQRSFLIKTQNSSQIISRACDEQRKIIKNPAALSAIDDIQEKILSCLMGIFEYRQLDFLNKIYEHEIKVTDECAIEEYKRVCGEYGASVVEKLNVSNGTSAADLEKIAAERSRECNARYQMEYYKSRENSELFRMLASSYDHLAKDIHEIDVKTREAEKLIKMYNSFLYGK